MDEIVYGLYGITEMERNIIEGEKHSENCLKQKIH